MVSLFQNSRIREVTLCPNTSLLSTSLLCRTPLSSKAAVNVRLPASLLARQAAPLATWSAQNRKKQKQRERNCRAFARPSPRPCRLGAFYMWDWRWRKRHLWRIVRKNSAKCVMVVAAHKIWKRRKFYMKDGIISFKTKVVWGSLMCL